MVKAYCLTAKFKTNSSIVSMEASPEPAANEYFFISNEASLGLADFQATRREGANILPHSLYSLPSISFS